MTELEKVAYNCKKTTFLIEKSQEIILTAKEDWEVKFHLAGCPGCTLYQKQSIMINEMIGKLLNEKPLRDVKLDDSYKNYLKDHINNQLGSD